MHPARLHVDPAPRAERLFRRPRVPGVRDGERAAADQVRRAAAVGVGCVVGVSAERGGVVSLGGGMGGGRESRTGRRSR